MKLSIVTAVLNSPEVVRRHALWYRKMPLPEGVEWIVVDDKSTPPLEADPALPQMRVLRHERPGVWTQPAARNFGCRAAQGQKLICTDIDHIIDRALIDFALATGYDFVKLRREVAVLDENGDFVQTPEEMLRYGFEPRRFASKGFHIAPHTNSFIVDRELYLRLGGVSERRVHLNRHPNREEIPFRKRIWQERREGRAKVLDEEGEEDRPLIYMFPNGQYCGHKDFNPFGLFHTLERKTR